MNTATQNLENDHVSILRLCDVILALVEKQSSDVSHFESVIQLIRNFADGTHHAKEEDFLFPLLAEKGLSAEHGPVAVMLHEHEQGRHFVKEAAKSIEDYKSGNSDALQNIYNNLSDYAFLLQGHIDKENNILFRMADQAFSEVEQQNLLSEFATIENNIEAELAPDKAIETINMLVTEFLG